MMNRVFLRYIYVVLALYFSVSLLVHSTHVISLGRDVADGVHIDLFSVILVLWFLLGIRILNGKQGYYIKLFALKFLFASLLLLYHYLLSGSMFLFGSYGDDYEYFNMANEFSSNPFLLLENAETYYRWPFTFVLAIFCSVVGYVELFIIVQISMSVASVYYLRRILASLFEDRQIVDLTVTLFALNLTVCLFSSFLYKDILVNLLFLMYLNTLLTQRWSSKTVLMLGVIIACTLMFRYFLAFIQIFGIALVVVTNSNIYMQKQRWGRLKPFFISLLMLMAVGVYFSNYSGLLDQLLMTYDLIDSRLATRNANSVVETSFITQLLSLPAFLHIPAPMPMDLQRLWSGLDFLTVTPRIYNAFIGVLMLIGICCMRRQKANVFFIVLLIVSLLGLAAVGMILQDRHKMSFYPIAYYFVCAGLIFLKEKHQQSKLFASSILVVGIVASIALQVVYNSMRVGAG